MRLRERIAWGLVGTALALAASKAAATPDCDSGSTTTTTTEPGLIIEPPHLLPPVTLQYLPETALRDVR